MFVVALIYAFLVGVSSLESGIKIMGEDTTERLFSAAGNPIAALCIGILGTILVQSSSASTSIIVGLVATGKLGVDDAVPMAMGANIGTTVTNTLVSLGHIRQSSEFRRAFAAATDSSRSHTTLMVACHTAGLNSRKMRSASSWLVLPSWAQ